MEEIQQEQESVEIKPSQPRNFVIPGANVVVQCREDSGMPIEQLLSIVFQLASSNPDAKVDFWIKVMGDG